MNICITFLNKNKLERVFRGQFHEHNSENLLKIIIV